MTGDFRIDQTDGERSDLDRVVAAQKRGEALGIPSICSANATVLKAIMRRAVQRGEPVLVESTSNQVNQYGGYMGQTPTQFRAALHQLADQVGFDARRIILGGDHLGPNAWQREPAAAAMDKACALVAACVAAGYTKIHLDASMRLGDDPAPCAPAETLAERSALLCLAAEKAWKGSQPGTVQPRYVIGAEVPIPGGEVGESPTLQVTSASSAQATLEVTRQVFYRAGLEDAWQRVIGLVVQPGVDFGSEVIHLYQHEKAAGLARWIEDIPGIVFEAHSTDYQPVERLRQLVKDHFAILKVGPALTFAFREAVFALEHIERELLASDDAHSLSHLQGRVEQAMLRDPSHWQPYYQGAPAEQRFMRRFSLSDRIRYYWTAPDVSAALDLLVANLSARRIPAALASQYLPGDVQLDERVESPVELIYRHVQRVYDGYLLACNGVKYH